MHQKQYHIQYHFSNFMVFILMNLVCDTNVILSALTYNLGASHQLVRWLFQQNNHINCLSVPLVLELEDVLLRPKNRERMPQFSDLDLKSFVDDWCHISKPIEIYYLWRPILKDHKDDMVLELAVNANADYLITFNTKDFQMVYNQFNFKLATPKQFLTEIGVI